MKAVILAGGLGKRLRPFTENNPKCMIEIAGIPIIERQIHWLRGCNVKEIILCVGHLKEPILNRIGSGKKLGVSVIYSVEEEPLGTAGALRNAKPFVQGDNFFVVNGDVLTDLNPWQLAFDSTGNQFACIATIPLRSSFGVIQAENGIVNAFWEKPLLNDYWMNAGVYCLSNKIFGVLPMKGDIEKETFPRLASERRIASVRYHHVYWRSIDSHKDIEDGCKELGDLSGATSPDYKSAPEIQPQLVIVKSNVQSN